MIELRTLGALELTRPDGTSLTSVLVQPRRVALLCYLAVAPAAGFIRRDLIYTIFWPEHDADQARHALRQALYFLRRALGSEVIVSRGDNELGLASNLLRCDAREFEKALSEGRLKAALDLYLGDLLSGFHVSEAPDFERWVEDERSRLKARAATAAWTLAESSAEQGGSATAFEWGRRAAGFAPDDEATAHRLMVLLDRLGDRAAALRSYQAFARHLEREYALQPSEALQALAARLSASGTDGTLHDHRLSRPPQVSSSLTTSPPEPPEIPKAYRPRARGTPAGWLMRTGAALGLGIALVWLVAWRMTGPAPARPERLIVAESQEPFGDLLVLVLRSELARSPLVRIAGRETLARYLANMRLEPGAPLTVEIARELALRSRSKGVVTGQARLVGQSVIFSVRLIDPESGEVIHGVSETARDTTEVPAALHRLVTALRREIGESIGSIQSGDTLWAFTTTSLEALRRHMAGSRAYITGDFHEAVQLFQEVLALDSGFVHAYIMLSGSASETLLPRGIGLRAQAKAYQLRDGLPTKERLAVIGSYHLGRGDLPQAIEAFRGHLNAREPGDPGWFESFGGLLVVDGDLRGAARVLLEASREFPTGGSQALLIDVLYGMGRKRQAAAVLNQAERQYPEHPLVKTARVHLLASSGRYREAHTLAAEIPDDAGRFPGLRLQAELDAVRGRYREAGEHLAALRDFVYRRYGPPPAIEITAAIGRLQFLAGDPRGATAVDHLLVSSGLDTMSVLDRPDLPLVLFFAAIGRPSQARYWLTRFERELPPEFQGRFQWLLRRARAATLRAEGKLPEAISELRQADRFPPIQTGLMAERLRRTAATAELAELYDQLGQTDSAIAMYERYLGVRELGRPATDAYHLAGALQRLTFRYRERGDEKQATAYSRRLRDLWIDADRSVRDRIQ